MRRSFIPAVTMLVAILFTPPVLSQYGGGGGGMAPSTSGPSFDPAAEYQKGIEAYKAGQYKDAARAFRKLVEVVPRNAQVQYMLGASLLGAGEFKKAVRPLDKAVKYDGSMIEARRDLAVAAARSGDTKRSEEQIVALRAMDASCAATCPDAARLAAAIATVEAAIAGGGAPH